ncbi:phosphotransferase family protein [Halocalculus aciditolerans]|uniref:Aminoglycoside phosphotransferase domain-containing protein n=1 Tax=Halocalculus aciditolerans TaxID=1383812 RepID=A0A830FMV3_9EURY|nr:phosphotransferase [Halocalculus aciditolerans]GGL62326.1 hypothetical protein GCM10009039_20530 [Halocalculus aciditolerans]
MEHRDRVTAAVSAAFPRREIAAVESAGPSWNDANATARVTLADGDVRYVKVGLDGDPTRIRRERAVIDYVRAHAGVPVPRVVASDTARATPYLATAPMDGESLIHPWGERSGGDRLPLARAVGSALARVHDCRFDAHGHVTGGDAGGLDVAERSWPTLLAERVEWTRDLASTDRFDEHFDRVKAAVEANRDLLSDAPAALAHGDPAMPNAVWNGEAVGFLDWELAYVGDPARDLYRALDQQFAGLREDAPAAVREACLDGYRSVAGGLPEGYAEREPVYAAVRFLGVSGYVDKYLDLVDEEDADFVAWVDAEMTARLDAC